jgi:hypothetical protein
MAAAPACVALGPAHPRRVLYAGLVMAMMLFMESWARQPRIELAFRLTLLSAGLVVVTMLVAGVPL